METGQWRGKIETDVVVVEVIYIYTPELKGETRNIDKKVIVINEGGEKV